MKKILVILGHSFNEGFNGQLCDVYFNAIKAKKGEVRILRLGDLKFDPILHKGYREMQELEPDLKKAQEDIKWADHITLAFPTWWSAFPAILKGFIDRILLPGFGFKFKDNGMWDKLLKGKSARLIVTMDAPLSFYKLFSHKAGVYAIKNGTLKFCGIKPVKTTYIAGLKNKDDEQKKEILENIKKLAIKDLK